MRTASPVLELRPTISKSVPVCCGKSARFTISMSVIMSPVVLSLAYYYHPIGAVPQKSSVRRSQDPDSLNVLGLSVGEYAERNREVAPYFTAVSDPKHFGAAALVVAREGHPESRQGMLPSLRQGGEEGVPMLPEDANIGGMNV